MSHFRIRYTQEGIHVRMRVFVGFSRDATYVNCGSLCMRLNEFNAFSYALRKLNPYIIEFVDETRKEAIV